MMHATFDATQSASLLARTEFLHTTAGRLAYRSIGTGPALVLLHRFRAAIDDWDPLFLDTLARGRRVIVFDSAGVGESAGEVPATLEGASEVAADFIAALGVESADVLGWSMGGMTAQLLAVTRPDIVRRVVLAGTLPAGGSPEVVPSGQEWSQIAGKADYADEDILRLFFTDTKASREAGLASLTRMTTAERTGSSVKTMPEVMQRQLGAIIGFYKNDGGWYERLEEITVPVFVANGDLDGAFPVIDSVVLARQIAGAQLAIYPNSGHGFLFQYAERFANDILMFLDQEAG
jgi:pimeloyl-ACP methyl ester carboxylesterase